MIKQIPVIYQTVKIQQSHQYVFHIYREIINDPSLNVWEFKKNVISDVSYYMTHDITDWWKQKVDDYNNKVNTQQFFHWYYLAFKSQDQEKLTICCKVATFSKFK